MLKFVIDNIELVLFLVFIIMYAALRWNNFKAHCYALMLQAKRMAKDEILNSGEEQVAWVVNKTYQFLPRTITIFISEKLMEKIVFYLYGRLKDYMDDGLFNRSM